MVASPPFLELDQLLAGLGCDFATPGSGEIRQTNTTLPGHPEIKLQDYNKVRAILETELWARDLENIAPHLWLLTTQSSSNISPLHRQKVKGRELIVTHDPRLHLVWLHGRIFIKPIPPYLLSYNFWKAFLTPGAFERANRPVSVPRAARGFLRTYRHLIRYETDLLIAQKSDLRLVPDNVDWPSFSRFISQIEHVSDVAVSGRYQYGEIRLSRLNFYAPFLLNKFYYEQIHGQYSDFFGRLFGPVLFIFAIVSTILNSLQVGVAVDQVSDLHWRFWWSISRWFSVISLLGASAIACGIMLLWTWIFVDEWIFAVRCRRRRKDLQTSV